MSDGKILTGGGKDRKIYEWNQSYKKTGMEVEVLKIFKQLYFHLRMFNI